MTARRVIDRLPLAATVRRRFEAARRARGRGQEGYMLAMVLAAMVVGLTLITGLLGLSFATQSAAIAQQRLARERRAADGALEAGVERLRAAASPASDCAALGSTPMAVPMDVQGQGTDANVKVSCQGVLDPSPNVTGSTTVFKDADGALTHRGTQPLRFVGSVAVKGGATLDGHVPSGTGAGAAVSGDYRQGRACGAGLVPGGGVPTGHELLDADYNPACSQTIDAAVPASSLPMPGNVTGIPGCGTALSPGYYGPAAVAQLNALLSTCDTVVFAPSTGPTLTPYWFDAGASGTLAFGRVGATYIFGTPAGNGCDPAATGRIAVVLGGGTALAHTAGRLSICAGAGSTTPALSRAPTAQVQPILTVTANDFTDTLPPNSAVICPAATYLDMTWGWNPKCGPKAVTAAISQPGVPSISALTLRWNSQEWPPSFDVNRWLTVSLTKGPATVCTTSGQRGRVAAPTGTEVDLAGACLGPVNANGGLNGMQVRVQYNTDRADYWNSACVPGEECPFRLSVSNLQLVTDAQEVRATAASGSYGTVDNLRSPGGGSASVEDCTYTYSSIAVPDVCDRSAGAAAADFTLTFAKPASAAATDHLSALVLAMDNAGGNDLVAPPDSPGPGSTRVEVRKPGAPGFSACVTAPTYSRSKRTVLVDLSACVPGSTFGDLEGMQVKVTVNPESRMVLGGNWVAAGLERPQIDFARLLVSTDTVHGTPSVKVTTDLNTGTSFTLNGDASLGSTPLELVWAGTADNRPLFNGNLLVDSIDSHAPTPTSATQVGVVCCGAELTNLLVTADVGSPKPRGVARVRLDTGGGGGTAAVITDWQLCDGDGCTINAVPAP